ncbi:MAG: hypothetical protein ACPG4W_00060 [Flavobacteriales bacterium]
MKNLLISFLKLVLKIYPEKYREYYQTLAVYKANTFRFGMRKRFLKEVERRKTLSIFDVDSLSQNLPSYSDEYYYVNSRFAIAQNLRQFSKWNKPINAIIEHGIYYDDYIIDFEVYKNRFPAILTFGPIRYNFFKTLGNVNKSIHKIGPHIAYVDSLLSVDKLEELKSELGSVLLVFPLHSIESHSTKFDYTSWIKEISKVGKDYDTVVVSIYYQDIVINNHLPYLKAGFKVVTAGHRSDLNFLPRVKSIISLSDMTMANDIGTSLGYCLHLKKPHYIYWQEMDFVVTENALKEHTDTKNIKPHYVTAFDQVRTTITPEQWEIYDQVWGGEASLKTPEELYNLFESFDKKKPFWL